MFELELLTLSCITKEVVLVVSFSIPNATVTICTGQIEMGRMIPTPRS